NQRGDAEDGRGDPGEQHQRRRRPGGPVVLRPDGKTTDTQRSTLISTSRKMLLNMLRNMTKEVNLHMARPNSQSDVASCTAVKGRLAQNMKSEMARLRYQVVLTDLFILKPEIQMTTPFPQTPSRKMTMLKAERIGLCLSSGTVSVMSLLVPLVCCV
ncbi:hypothetical protein ANANG_G00317270, partial [Anguilla anguilla]